MVASPSCCRFRYEATTASAAVTACSVTPICSYAESRARRAVRTSRAADSSVAASWVRAWLAIRRFAATSARAELFPIGTEKLNPTDQMGYRVLPKSPIASP